MHTLAVLADNRYSLTVSRQNVLNSIKFTFLVTDRKVLFVTCWKQTFVGGFFFLFILGRNGYFFFFQSVGRVGGRLRHS